MDKTAIRATLALNIKTLRSRRNWSQADLAEKSGLSIVYLSDIERGNKWPYLDTMIKLANAFKIEVYELLKPENIPPPTVSTIIGKYSDDMKAIISKTLETAEKNALQSLETLQKQCLEKHQGQKD